VPSQCLGFRIKFKNSISQDFPFLQYYELENRSWNLDLERQSFYSNECKNNGKFGWNI